MRLFSIMIIALMSVNLSAQTLSEADDKEIRSRMSEYIELTKANDFNKMMDYVYPKVFTMATREQMIAVFDGLETMGIGLNVDEMALNTVEPLHEGDDKKYVLTNYTASIRLELKSSQMQNPEVVKSLSDTFKAQYSADEVNYDEESKILSFTGNKYVVAIQDPEFGGEAWNFMEFDASNPQLAQLLLSSDAYNKLMEKIK